MAAIRAQCFACGVVDLSAEQISLHLHPSGARGAYRFTCPHCRSEIDRPANQETVALLLAVGVETVGARDETSARDLTLPPEDRSPDPRAAALTLDDVITFHFLLESDERDGATARMLSPEP
jgi:hypothetical protein